MNRYLLSLFLLCVIIPIKAKGSSDLRCNEYRDYLLTHQLTPFGPVPTVYDPNGVYPYISYCETSNRPVLQEYRFVSLENAYVKITICPDLGGKVLSIIHKESGREVLYVPDVIRQTRILPRFYFVAGGIEVSFPISHTPTQNESVSYQIDKTDNRIYLTCGERELRFGMHWSVEYSLGENDTFLTQRVVFHNPGKQAYPWMSWSNAAVPSAPDTQYDFPKGEVLVHSSILDTIRWEKDGPKTEADIKEMTGYFWQTKDVNAFGAFTPSLGTGLYHIADEKITGGIKLWSYGVDKDSIWSVLSTANKRPYVEIQGGPIADQSIKLEMQPGETRWHTEYWIPTDRRLDLYGLKLPGTKLRSIESIPVFGWSRKGEVDLWLQLKAAYLSGANLPEAPEITSYLWAPSGMEDLDEAFKWAIRSTTGEASALWKLYYGAWLAGRERMDEAISVLSVSENDIARVLSARLLYLQGKTEEAVQAINSIRNRSLQLHPQIIVERDQLLRSVNHKSIEEREKWLSAVDALDDEWIIERRVQLLIDKGEIQAAKSLLLSTHFQLVHQTYTRTSLWEQICKQLGEPAYPVPVQLGEDNLARFGAYREYE
ncbi:hypothetical protein M2459_000424 [Parabacteroides sp. PF5-5]|uniref:DUF5107 domain-containing protein n=1 Tax=unclassified Parabacteroides TaxID=2649774 RepID=UPI0024767A3B|nr:MULTISPECIES: DUF5107 domain-containing protein [unclassified Parabacteroides]MDH6303642.1 hypothetical protein [Parabacteroides sp. PH5-39]MDH6314964.1 hypothetical protein [Parabacteroides sp. PF5-13]MDH6318301.1 hypothetical protein [Parabacteroides sp. PH5-13]MDH6321766.1 hypothetical protein [Parabacteroides sp. PH5-8]MDH6325890.1 hypothetical protein [Parabacteroides sp. PH5-41]